MKEIGCQRLCLFLTWACSVASTVSDVDRRAFPEQLVMEDDEGEWEWTEQDRIEEDLYMYISDEGDRLGSLSAEEASKLIAKQLFDGSSVEQKIHSLFENTHSTECRVLIAKHFGYFMAALGKEEPMPFTKWRLENTCPEPVYDHENLPEGISLKDIMNHTYQPPPHEAEYIGNPENLKILYAILTHEEAESTIRLVNALYEPGHNFVIHVDAKEMSDATFDSLSQFADTLDYVHVIPDPYRVRIAWGGFSMVNATLQMFKYAVGLLPCTVGGQIDFHKVVHISSTTYPIASKAKIREEISKYPLDANFMQVVNFPLRPPHWSYFCECDDKLHRIYDLEVPTGTKSGFDLYTASQWFILSSDFAQYLALAEPGSFVYGFLEYAEHIVVADETFFGTVLKNTEFCQTLQCTNYHFVAFDAFDGDKPLEHRDLKKRCPMKDPDVCGRSPATLNLDDIAVLGMREDLFARKFAAENSVKDSIDRLRISGVRSNSGGASNNSYSFEGQNVVLMAKKFIERGLFLCLGLSGKGMSISLLPCFLESTPRFSKWETGVSETEVSNDSRWHIGPCSNFFAIQNDRTPTDPMCIIEPSMIQDGCLDAHEAGRPGDGRLHVGSCRRPWSQLLSFGNGTVAPRGALYVTVPTYAVNTMKLQGYDQHKYQCVGFDEQQDSEEAKTDLKLTSCKNHQAVIEWMIVPLHQVFTA